MRIGEVAARSGVSTRALRYYEEQQLLASQRSPSGQRSYPPEAVERVQLIQRLYSTGLNSKAIAELLPCVYTGVATPAMLDRLYTQCESIDRQIAELTEARARLNEVIEVAHRHAAVASAA